MFHIKCVYLTDLYHFAVWKRSFLPYWPAVHVRRGTVVCFSAIFDLIKQNWFKFNHESLDSARDV